jgi:hypothetical protein
MMNEQKKRDIIERRMAGWRQGRLVEEALNPQTSSAGTAPPRQTPAENQQPIVVVSGLQVQSCQVCYETMISPQRTPYVLSPCGHTFCRECVGKNQQVGRKPKCPLCRKSIQYSVENILLKQIIEREHEAQRKEVLQQRRAPAAPAGNVLDNCSIRLRILAEELRRTEEDHQASITRQQSADLAVKHLKQEKTSLLAQIASLQDELELVDRHLAQAQQKCHSLTDRQLEAQKKAEMLRKTMAALEIDRQKADLLSGHSFTATS